MDNFELDRLARKDVYLAKKWGGVYALDLVPKNLADNFIYVCSDQPHYIKYGHWRLISNIGKTLYWFDSYGHAPTNSHVINTLKKTQKPLEYSTIQVQQDTSTVCSYHCLFVALLLARGFNLEEILDHFYSADLLYNDVMATEFISAFLDLKETPPLYDSSFL